MLNVILISFFSALISFLFVYRFTPFLIERMHKRGLVGKDMNKLNKPKVAELGGISIYLGLAIGIIIPIFCFSYLRVISFNLSILLAGFATISLISFIGLIDDLIGWKNGIRQWQHALVPIFAALPLMAIKVNSIPFAIPIFGMLPHEFMIPLFGAVSFGAIYSLFIVPIGVTGASNATNMLAGHNGLEASLGILLLLPMIYFSILQGSVEAVIIGFAVVGSLFAFLKFNWFPAKIFGGDSLTLLTGSSVAVLAIIGNLEKVGILLLFLFYIEFLIKAKHKFQTENFGIPDKNGILHPDPKGGSFVHVILRKKPMSEKKLVLTLIVMQIIVDVFVITISELGYMGLISF